MSNSKSNSPSAKVIRYLVRHFHRPRPEDRTEEVVVSYNADDPAALSYAINTASRYNGIIYGDTGAGDYVFLRSYMKRRPKVASDQENEKPSEIPMEQLTAPDIELSVVSA